MGRFGKFNPRQKRDRKGRWSKGGGSFGGKKGSGTLPLKSGKRPGSAKIKSNRDRNRALRGAALGGALGFVSTFGTPIGAIVGAAVGGGLARKRKKG